MNRRIIKSVLVRKMKDWLESIESEEVKALVKKNTIISGGCIPSMLMREKVSDFDIYFRDKETVIAVSEYYVKKFNSRHGTDHRVEQQEDDQGIWTGRISIYIKGAGIAGENPDDQSEKEIVDVLENSNPIEKKKEEEEPKEKYRPVFLSSNAITLSNKIQCIIRFYGEPDKIHENYDFVHVMNYFDSGDNSLEIKKEALESMITKQLVYRGSLFPVASLIRMRKFIKKGWHISAGQILKICLQISDLDLSKFSVIEEQLCGVDTAYFEHLLIVLRNKVASDDKVITRSYMIEVIRRIYDTV